MRMNYRRNMLILLVAISSLISCEAGVNAEKLRPPGSYNVRIIERGFSDKEYAFLVEDTYPGGRVMEYYDDIFQNNNYRECTSQVPDWDVYFDMSTGEKRVIFQLQRVLVNMHAGHVLFLVFSYSSYGDSRDSPDTDVMSASVQVFKYKDSAERRQLLGALSATCNGLME